MSQNGSLRNRSWRTGVLVVLVTMLATLPLVGCYDLIELEQMAFILTLGIDQGPHHTIDVTARIAVPSTEAGGGGSGGGSGGTEKFMGGTEPITVRAHTIAEALSLMNTVVERRISLIHLNTIVFGEKTAKAGVISYIRSLARMREVRRTISMFVATSTAREAFLTNKPVIEKSIARWSVDLDQVAKSTGISLTERLHDFIIATETPFSDPVIPFIAINKEKVGEKPEKEKKIPEDQQVSFEPGKVARVGGNVHEYLGVAIFRGDKMVAALNGIDTRMLLAIRGELKRTQMDFPDPKEQGEVKYVALELKHARSPKVEIDVQAQPVRIRLTEKLEGDLIASQGETDYSVPENMETLEKAVRKHIEEQQVKLIERLYHEHQVEPFALFQRARSQFLSYGELEKYDLREKLKTAKVELVIDFQLRRVGIQLSPIKEK